MTTLGFSAEEMVEFAPSALVGIDGAGRIMLANAQAERLFGYSRRELIGKPIEMLVPERFRKRHPALLRSFFADPLPRPMGAGRELFALKKDGTEFAVEIGLNPIETAAGTMVLSSILDVSIYKRLLQELEAKSRALTEANDQLRHEIAARVKVEEQLLQARKMEAIGQLTGGLAHDFNNMLQAVIGHIDMTLGRPLDAATEKSLRAAMQAAERCARLTSQLLAFARRLPLNVRAVDLRALVFGLKEMLAGTLTPAIRIDLSFEPELWLALADPTQIELALFNLALNARDAMPSGGRLSIEARNVAATDPDRPADLKADAVGWVALTVRDSGAGMTEEVKARVFEPFFTTKDVGKGTGLGLATVYGLAKQLNGTVRIHSELGRGTAVTIYLPRAMQSQGQPAQTARGKPLWSGLEQANVLLVDDNEDVRDVVATSLLQAGCTVTEAANGEAALKIINSGAAIDLLVTDLVMPGMPGAVLAEEARLRRPDLAVLLISGYQFDRVKREPPFPLLRKPFRSAELLAAAAQCVRQGAAASARTPAWPGTGPASE